MGTKNEELFDKDLQKLVRFTDESQNAEKKKTAKKPKDEAVNAKFEPVKSDHGWMDRLKACAKWVAVFGGLCILFCYWQQSGQMQPSAAVPSMCVCTLMAGVGIGRNWWRG